jgi:hypothetical protein
MPEKIACTPKYLPKDKLIEAADQAARVNPYNKARVSGLGIGFQPSKEHLAAMAKKYWQIGGVHLTVGFLDDPEPDLRARILSHMNAWGATANVQFSENDDSPDVRIARTAGDGYWSYIGTDIQSIAADQPTMNLDSFSMDTPEEEYHRVVRHETGHTMGFPHEHMRQELVDRIDRQKAIEYYGATQGWDEQTVIEQVLTPIEDSQLLETPTADENSIMCYQIPSSITIDGQPIVGGLDIDQMDADFAALLYPLPVAPPAPGGGV